MNTEQRLHALDAVRAFALLAGIVLHATMSFFLPIPAQDSSQSATLGVVFFVIHIFRMSLFYLIAGFFGRMLIERRGMRAFVKDRSKRILAPLAGGWILLAPLTIGAVIWGVTRQGTDLEALAAGTKAPTGGFPLVHLWFLYYLCMFYAAALALRYAASRIGGHGRVAAGLDRLVRGLAGSHAGPLVLAVPVAATLYVVRAPLWGGIPTPDVGLTPQLPALIAFGTAFGLGWLLHRQIELLGELGKRWAVHLALAVALAAACLYMIGEPSLAEPAALEGWLRVAYVACYAVAIWCFGFGLIGAALRFCDDASPVRRYLADASYWLYLAHLPLIFFLQVALADLAWHWTLKFPLILGVSMAILLASYHYLVRATFVGELLNGRRHLRGKRSFPPRDPDPDGPRDGRRDAAVAELRNVTKRYGETIALAGVDLAVERGELLAVLGPNGAGKSTAISLWLGLLEPDAGTVSLMGGSPLDAAGRLDVGVMMQEVNLAADLRARELVDLTASCYASPLSADAAMALTGTTALAATRYGKLSAGQKRQVQFAAAVCGRPKVLFLDEPTVGLDIRARQTMWRTIRSLLDGGCSIVLTTHYLEEAEALADRVAVLAQGQLIALGSVADMRALVSRKQIRCRSTAALDEIRRWPGVVEAVRDADVVQITATDAESVVRRLLGADENVSALEVRQATLAEAFTELTEEAA